MDETALRVMQLAGGGLCCSQIMMKLALEDMGEENTPLIRAMAGLCEGFGSGELCGVASGALCVLALYAGPGDDGQPALDCYPLLVDQFMEWFKGNQTTWGGIRCDEIIAYQGGKKPEVCGDIMLKARDILLGLLAENNIDPTLPREQSSAF